MNDLSPSLTNETSGQRRAATFVKGPQRRPIVLVLGMHRSGTSLCSHLLSMLGVDMADRAPGPGHATPGPDNPRGHWERWEIVEFHDRILNLFDRGYFTPFHDFPLPVAWWADPRVAEIRREIIAFLDHRMGDGYFGFKDPRTVRLMPVWHQILRELKLAPRIVLCLRNPAQVARSLTARDGIDRDIAEYRWFSYMIDFFRYTVGSDSCTVQYEEWFNDPSVNIKKLRNFLDLRWEQTELDLDLAISGIVDQALRHDDPSQREADQPPVRLLYNLARRADHDNAAREQLRSIVSQFISFQQFQRPFHRAFENLSRLAANLPPIEQEAAALRAALHERDTTVDAANEKASATEARLAVSVAENEAQRAHLGAIERELADRNAMATALQAEIQTLRNALTAAERREQERDATVEALRNALGRAELKGAEAGAVAETMRAEIGSLHRSLAQAEARGREGEAAAAARQAQIRSLQSELAAARDVGKAALVSLRITPAPILPSARDTGWLGVMLRRFGRSVNYPLPSAG